MEPFMKPGGAPPTPSTLKLLNSSAAKALFDREAILLGSSDGVPVHRAAMLFGQAAVDFARRSGTGNYNGYGVGDYTLHYLTLKGFQTAATFCNVQQVRQEAATSE